MATGKFNRRSGFVRFNLAAVILITFLPVLLGCRGPSPLQNLYKYDVAFNRQDREEVKKYCTASYIERRFAPGEQMGGLAGPAGGPVPVPPELIPSYSEFKNSFTVEISGNTARCIQSYGDSGLGDLVYTMKFTGGGWKVDSVHYE